MPGDEVHEEAGGGAASAPAGRGGTGPRHALPRKPLLTRLHMPAGKAIALAAMPTVLLGMGVTPQFANAKPIPKNPFRDGSCVSMPDKGQEDEKATEKGSAADDPGKALEQGGDSAAEAGEKATTAVEQAAEDAKKRATKAVEDAEKAAKKYAAEKKKQQGEDGEDADSGADEGEAPEEEKPKNPLDPLGLGDKLKELFTPKEEKAAESGESDEDGEAEDESEPTETDPLLKKLQKRADDAKEKAEKALDEAEVAVAKAKKAAESGEDDEKGSGSGKGETGSGNGKEGKEGKDGESKAGEDADAGESGDGKAPELDENGRDANGKQPFPCVEEKKDEGEDEQTPAAVPDDPWTLKATSLTLHGLDYEGVVNIRTAGGKTKQALKFTANGLEIGDLHQIVEGAGGTKYHVQAAEGSTSTIDDGQVTMYTEELKGNLFGLIPITFDPEHPPPLNIPEAYFTKVTVKQAAQFGGTLTVPGLQQSIT